jgi:hypothetical protein
VAKGAEIKKFATQVETDPIMTINFEASSDQRFEYDDATIDPSRADPPVLYAGQLKGELYEQQYKHLGSSATHMHLQQSVGTPSATFSLFFK